MTYDFNELRLRVAKKRKMFFVRAAIVVLLMLCALVSALIGFNDAVTIIGFLAELPLLYILLGIINKHQAKIILSRELVGENIKEHEVGVQREGGAIYARRGNMPHTYANKKAAPRRVVGSLFLKLENGSVKEVSGLSEAELLIYEIGDTLMKPAGVRHLIVTSREVTNQPCPCCGKINNLKLDSACSDCGLKITE